MAHYITSHGQVAGCSYYQNDPALPLGDLSLTNLGREQARLLGEHLKSLEFHGLIVCSPMTHAMQTAAIIAEVTATRILPYAPLHERFPDEESLRGCRGTTLDALQSQYPAILPDAQLEYPWWPAAPEDENAVMLRIANGYQRMIAQYPQEDLLFLGHASTCEALVRLFELKPQKNTRQYNCALTTMNPTVLRFVPDVYNTWFLPYAKTTLNSKSREELDLAYFAAPHKEEIPMPDLSEFTGERVLHIGDTEPPDSTLYRVKVFG